MKNNSLSADYVGSVGPGSPLGLEQWQDKFKALTAHAEAMSVILLEVAREISADAGLDPNLLGLHPYNAMADKEHGRPWKDVDYNRCQVVLDLLNHQFDANRMVEAFDKAVRLEPHKRWLRENGII